MHIHVQKAESEAKFWILSTTGELKEAYSYNFSPADKQEVKKLIYLNLDFIIEKWSSIHGKK